MKKTFSKEKLFDRTPRVFKRDATEVRFLLGGIGTGNFSVNSRGKRRKRREGCSALL